MAQAFGLAGVARADGSADAAAGEFGDPTVLPNYVIEDQKPQAVASPKFTQPLVDTPQTVVVIPHEVFAGQGAVTLSDVLRNTPGISFAAGEGGSAASTAGDSFYLRGYDTTNNIFVDGVRDIGAYARDVFNIQQVEVAKGPEGSDIGRGGTSGYVNLVTKKPTLENFVAGTTSYGFDETTSGDRRRVALDVNEAIAQSPVPGTALRLNLMTQDSADAGRDVAFTKGWGVAPSLALGLGTPTRAYVSYEHEHQDNLPDYGLPTPAFPGYTSTPPAPAIDWTNFYGFLSDFDRVTHDAITAKVEHTDANGDVFSNQTRYSSVSREAIVTGPGSNAASYNPATGLLTRTRQGNKRDTSILSNQTNATGKFTLAGLENDVSAGLEFSREKAYSPAFVSVTLTPIPVASPDPTATPSGTPVRSGAYTNAHLKTGAAYAFDTLKLSEHWQIDGGLRLDHYRMDYLSVAVGGVPTFVNTDGNLLSSKAGLVFKPTKAGSVYAAWGLSYIPPGTDLALSSAVGNQNNPLVQPQRTTNFETGVKWDFLDGRLATTAALFKSENDNTVFTDPILGPIPTGRQTVQGLELGATGHPTEAWLVFAGFAYLDSEINAGLTTGNNPAGAELPLIPRVSGNLWTTYRFPFGLTLGGGAQYLGEVNRRDYTTTVPRQMPSYCLVSAVAAYEVSPHLTLRLNVSNLFDRRYVASFNNNGARFNPGLPRAYLLSADFKF
ncbi:MAG TPA: TonB-dependent siderophore receptor [Candidatus Didemnitutus sp.]|nr:TonB-dependent siderophore receptor [Candidatus Didemnitutus sp.]